LAKKTARQKSKTARRKRNRTLLTAVAAVALAAVVVAAFVLAMQGGGSSSKPSVRGATSLTPVVFTGQEASVKVIDTDYSPKAIRVPVGATVTWDFTGSLPHTVTDESKSFDSGTKQQGESFVHTFSSAGEFDYYCIIHHVMAGRVIVGP
jgi:plastocyanin